MSLLNDDDELIDVGAVARSAYIISHIDKLLQVMTEAELVHHSLPKELRTAVEGTLQLEDEQTLNETAIHRLAYDLGKYPASLVSVLKGMLVETRHYVGVWVEGDGEESQLFGMLTEDDIAVIELMVTLVQKVGARSTRHLLHFLEGFAEGERGYLVIQGHGSQSEIVHRTRISDHAKGEFDLK